MLICAPRVQNIVHNNIEHLLSLIYVHFTFNVTLESYFIGNHNHFSSVAMYTHIYHLRLYHSLGFWNNMKTRQNFGFCLYENTAKPKNDRSSSHLQDHAQVLKYKVVLTATVEHHLPVTALFHLMCGYITGIV